MQRVISSILGARDMVLDKSRLGPKIELLDRFAGSVVVGKDSTTLGFRYMVFCSGGDCERRGRVEAEQGFHRARVLK